MNNNNIIFNNTYPVSYVNHLKNIPNDTPVYNIIYDKYHDNQKIENKEYVTTTIFIINNKKYKYVLFYNISTMFQEHLNDLKKTKPSMLKYCIAIYNIKHNYRLFNETINNIKLNILNKIKEFNNNII